MVSTQSPPSGREQTETSSSSSSTSSIVNTNSTPDLKSLIIKSSLTSTLNNANNKIDDVDVEQKMELDEVVVSSNGTNQKHDELKEEKVEEEEETVSLSAKHLNKSVKINSETFNSNSISSDENKDNVKLMLNGTSHIKNGGLNGHEQMKEEEEAVDDDVPLDGLAKVEPLSCEKANENEMIIDDNGDLINSNLDNENEKEKLSVDCKRNLKRTLKLSDEKMKILKQQKILKLQQLKIELCNEEAKLILFKKLYYSQRMPAGQAAGAMGSQRNANMAGVQNNLKNNQQMQAGAKPQMQRGNGSQFLQNNNSMQQRSLINERVSLNKLHGIIFLRVRVKLLLF